MTLGVLAGLVQLAGYWHYYWLMSLEKGHKPNAASWLMWALGGATELVVFAALVQDPAKEILPAVCGVAAIAIFIQMLRRGAMVQLDTWEKVTIGFDAVVLVFYVVTKDVVVSNILLSIDLVLSFSPTLWSTWKQPKREHPTPWHLWTLAYALLTLVVIIERDSNWEFIYPVTCVVLHILVALFTRRDRLSSLPAPTL